MKQPWIATALVAWGVGTSCLAPAGLWARPNILVITADDMRWDSVGAHGCPVAATTPTIDRLAAEGFRFHYAYVPISLCTPSRQVMMNGVLCTDFVDDMDAEGHIALQHHGEKGQVYRFRNIRISQTQESAQRTSVQLSYDEPAREWTNALPVGNGSMGAMVFGGD